MDLIPRTSYAKDFISTLKEHFNSDRYNGDGMDCADMFRGDEWKVDDDADYAENTRGDLIKLSSHDPVFQSFVKEVITCMKYNRNMEMN
jgi:hypothetical protein